MLAPKSGSQRGSYWLPFSLAETDVQGNNNYSAQFEYDSSLFGLSNLTRIRLSGNSGPSGFGISNYDTAMNLWMPLNGGLGIGSTSLLGTLDVRASGNTTNGGTIAIASVSGKTSFASLVVDNSGLGDIFTASSGGVPHFTIANNGNITDSSYTTNGGVLYTTSAGLVQSTATGTNAQCLISNGGGAPTWSACVTGGTGTNFWNLTNGAIYPINATADFLLGGTSTASAKFSVTGLNGTAGTLGKFSTNTNPLPLLRSRAGGVTANGYIYEIGGYDGTNTSTTTVYYAKLNGDGSTGSWLTTSALPGGLRGHTVVAVNGYVYAIAGYDGNTTQSAVYYAKINNDGTLGSWITSAQPILVAGRNRHSSVAANGYLYVIGGGTPNAPTNTVFYAKLNADGSTGSWTTNAQTLLDTRIGTSAVVANGFVYVIGGENTSTDTSEQSTVYFAKLNPDGSTGNWNTTTALPTPLSGQSSAVANGYVYVLGGENASDTNQSAVYFAKLNADGTVGSWNTNGSALPVAIKKSSTVVANGYIYQLGGDDNSNTPQTTVYYTSTARVSLAANLDLIGLTGGSLASASANAGEFGSVGGSIYAGNIFSNGQLEVTGGSQLWGGTGINGSLSVLSSGGGTDAGPVLDVEGSDSATGAASIWNTAAMSGGASSTCNNGCHTGLIVKLGSSGSTTFPGFNDHYLQFLRGDGGVMGYVRGTNNSGGATSLAYVTSGLDYAEYFKKTNPDEDMPAGTLVCLAANGGVTGCTSQNNQIVGIVSDNAGFVGGGNHDNGDPNYVLVGLVGQLQVQVSTINGPINPGDTITVSPQAGVGMKANKAGSIIGRALEAYTNVDTNAIGKITVVINPTWSDPSVQIAADGNLTTPTHTNTSLAASGLSLTGSLLPNNQQLDALSAQVAALQVQTASATASLARLDSLNDRVTNLEKEAVSSFISSASISGLLDNSFSSSDATISGSLSVLGKTLLSDLGITGKISAGLLTINGLDDSTATPSATINTLSGPLKLQSLALAGVDFLNGKVNIDTNGNLTVHAEVTAKKYNVDTTDVAGASIGEATIPAGQTSVIVKTSAVTDASKIFVESVNTPVSTAVKRTDPGTFTIKLAQPQNSDIKLDWWIVN